MWVAVRSLAHSPFFAVVALSTLALGLGATTAIFSVVNGVLLEPLPVSHPERLIYLRDSNPPQFSTYSVSPGNFLAWQRESSSFEVMGAASTGFHILTGAGEPERLRVDRATASLSPSSACSQSSAGSSVRLKIAQVEKLSWSSVNRCGDRDSHPIRRSLDVRSR